jgi:hypothetical protein
MTTLGQKTKVENMYNVTLLAIVTGVTYRGVNPTFLSALQQFLLYSCVHVPFILKKALCKASLTNLMSPVVNLIENQGETVDVSQFSVLTDLTLYEYRGEHVILSPGITYFNLNPASDMVAVPFSSLGIQGGTTTLKTLRMENLPLTDSNFNSFLSFGELETIAFNGISRVSGDLSVLGGLTHLIRIGFPNTMNVNCVLEDLVGHARTAGRTTGSITCEWAGASNTTFQGTKVLVKSSTVLSWTATTITYDGITIEA